MNFVLGDENIIWLYLGDTGNFKEEISVWRKLRGQRGHDRPLKRKNVTNARKIIETKRLDIGNDDEKGWKCIIRVRKQYHNRWRDVAMLLWCANRFWFFEDKDKLVTIRKSWWVRKKLYLYFSNRMESCSLLYWTRWTVPA